MNFSDEPKVLEDIDASKAPGGDARNSHVRYVQLLDVYSFEGLMRNHIFARFDTVGTVDIVHSCYTFDGDKPEVETTAITLGSDDFEALIKAWEEWQPFPDHPDAHAMAYKPKKNKSKKNISVVRDDTTP